MTDASIEDSSAPEPGSGSGRGADELVLAALTGSALAPFVQAIVTQMGNDVYSKIKGLLTRRGKKASHPLDGTITLADSATTIAIRLPTTLSAAEAAGIAKARMPSSGQRQGWLVLEPRPGSDEWTVTAITAPPSGAIEVGPGDGEVDD